VAAPGHPDQTHQAGQTLGIKELDEGVWLVSFMDYDLGYIDLEQRTLVGTCIFRATNRQPFWPGGVTYVLGTICYLCVRAGQA